MSTLWTLWTTILMDWMPMRPLCPWSLWPLTVRSISSSISTIPASIRIRTSLSRSTNTLSLCTVWIRILTPSITSTQTTFSLATASSFFSFSLKRWSRFLCITIQSRPLVDLLYVLLVLLWFVDESKVQNQLHDLLPRVAHLLLHQLPPLSWGCDNAL